MKAAVVTEFGGPLIVKDIPIPQPAPEQVLVKMETCGVCHTDIHAAQGDWPAKPTLPFVPGHEGIGVIEAVGSQVSKDRIGERVAIAWLGSRPAAIARPGHATVSGGRSDQISSDSSDLGRFMRARCK